MKRILSLTIAIITTTSVLLRAQEANTLRIAAASDLKFALDSILAVFRSKNPDDMEVTYGSSGKLFVQISNGAPFDVFFSADINYPNQLAKKGLTISEVHLYGVGRIVLWSKRVNPMQNGMASVLNPGVKKIAIANPKHAPYGQRAAEALEFYKLFDRVENKLVYGENIAQTAQFVAVGAADIGIVALSLARGPGMIGENGKYFLIPEASHRPLEQGAVLTRHAKDNKLAASFFDFVKSDAASAILFYFGFSKPDKP